jgi:hypothetical protein
MVAEKSNTHGGFGGHSGGFEQRSGSGGSFTGGVGNELGEGIGNHTFWLGIHSRNLLTALSVLQPVT